MSEEVEFRVLDPDTQKRSVNEAIDGNVNFVEVIRSGVAEKRPVCKNTVKAKLVHRTEEEWRKSADVEVESET